MRRMEQSLTHHFLIQLYLYIIYDFYVGVGAKITTLGADGQTGNIAQLWVPAYHHLGDH